MSDLIETPEQLDALLRLVSQEAEAAVVRDRLLRAWLIVENVYGEFFAYSYPTEGRTGDMERAEELLMPLDVLHRPGKTVVAEEMPDWEHCLIRCPQRVADGDALPTKRDVAKTLKQHQIRVITGNFNAACTCGWKGATINGDQDHREHVAEILVGRTDEVNAGASSLPEIALPTENEVRARVKVMLADKYHSDEVVAANIVSAIMALYLTRIEESQ